MNIITQEAVISRPSEYWLEHAGCLERLQSNPDFQTFTKGYLEDMRDTGVDMLAGVSDEQRSEVIEVLVGISYFREHLINVKQIAEDIEFDRTEGELE